MAKRQISIRLPEAALRILETDPSGSQSEAIEQLMADGLRQKMMSLKFRPPRSFVYTLNPDRLFVLYLRCQDALLGERGPLGGRYRFEKIPAISMYLEPNIETYIPVLENEVLDHTEYVDLQINKLNLDADDERILRGDGSK
jgi:hypothetical protein